MSSMISGLGRKPSTITIIDTIILTFVLLVLLSPTYFTVANGRPAWSY